MQTITFDSEQLTYTQKYSRGRGVRISIRPGGAVTVFAPRLMPQFLIDRFLQSKADWILEKHRALKKFPAPASKAAQRREYEANKERARALVHARVEYFNKYYGFVYGRISIRNQKTRWGSCSKKGNLNFSYKLALIQSELADYVVVHELCHLKEFNHSAAFWSLVAETIPQHRKLRKELKGCAV